MQLKRNFSEISDDVIGDNQMYGKLPFRIGSGAWTNLLSFSVKNNALKGIVPAAFELMPHLKHLDLSNNELTGLLFSEKKLGGIETCDLAGNLFRWVIVVEGRGLRKYILMMSSDVP